MTGALLRREEHAETRREKPCKDREVDAGVTLP